MSPRPIALITGASAGLGATFARGLAVEGYDLVLVARRTARLEKLAAEIHASRGVCVETMTADLTVDADVSLVCERLAGCERLELLVNNAGFGTRGLFFEADAEKGDAMHRLHVLATERLTRAALPGMVARRKGGIINVASVAGFLQGPGNVGYCATKAWMVSFTEGLQLELKSIGSPVVVQALCPGFTETEFHDVLGVDRARISPDWMPAEYVVKESIRGLKNGKFLVIPGLRSRVAAAMVTVGRLLIQAASTRIRAAYVK